MADTMGTREASEKWGYAQTTIAGWCKSGMIKGAIQYRNKGPWQIPKDASCPRDKKQRREK